MLDREARIPEALEDGGMHTTIPTFRHKSLFSFHLRKAKDCKRSGGERGQRYRFRELASAETTPYLEALSY